MRVFLNMPDTVTPDVRSRMMAGIRGKDTRPEMMVRRALHRLGFRFRLHDARLPGRPDIVLPRHRAAVLVHGCFWHGHGCHMFRWPASRAGFWRDKIGRNQSRDAAAFLEMDALGWRQAVIWECALSGRGRLPVDQVADICALWLRDGGRHLEIAGFACTLETPPAQPE